MKQAIIKDGVVVNICVGNAGGIEIPEDSPVAIGWSYNAGLFAAPALTITQRKAVIQAQIEALEQKTPILRPVREFMIAAAIKEASITINPLTSLAYTEPQLYSVNAGYKAVKDFDAKITALRLQMEAIV